MDNSFDPCGSDGGQWGYSIGRASEGASLTSLVSWQGWLEGYLY